MEENMEEGQTQKGTVLEGASVGLGHYAAAPWFALGSCQEG